MRGRQLGRTALRSSAPAAPRPSCLALRASGCAWALWILAGGCTERPASDPLIERAQRFGIFRDLVLFDLPGPRGPFFLDRFETTRADWAAFCAATGRPTPWVGDLPSGSDARPIANLDLDDARAYARWRFGRLPRRDEWEHAATARGAYRYPWGQQATPERVNCWDLGLDGPTPVGSFAAGREVGWPYDLLGNVAEWTDTIPEEWLRSPIVQRGSRPEIALRVSIARRRITSRGLQLLNPVPAPFPIAWIQQFRSRSARSRGIPRDWLQRTEPVVLPDLRAQRAAARLAMRSAAVRLWNPVPAPLPSAWIAAAHDSMLDPMDRAAPRMPKGGAPKAYPARRLSGLRLWFGATPMPAALLYPAFPERPPRHVVGGHFRSAFHLAARGTWLLAPQLRYAQERGETLGVRVAADPLQLLERLATFAGPVPEQDLELVRTFLRRHREVLLEPWQFVKRRVARPHGRLGQLVEGEL